MISRISIEILVTEVAKKEEFIRVSGKCDMELHSFNSAVGIVCACEL
jgi:hypothetical protein